MAMLHAHLLSFFVQSASRTGAHSINCDAAKRSKLFGLSFRASEDQSWHDCATLLHMFVEFVTFVPCEIAHSPIPWYISTSRSFHCSSLQIHSRSSCLHLESGCSETSQICCGTPTLLRRHAEVNFGAFLFIMVFRVALLILKTQDTEDVEVCMN